MLTEVNLCQGSPAWHKWRNSGAGSSDVKVILGESLHKTRWQLWAEKRGIKECADLSKNPHTRRGNFYEPRVRSVIEVKLGCKLKVMCAEDTNYPHRKVSFDGVTPQNIPVEIKCPDTNMWKGLVSYKRKSQVFLDYVDQLIYQIGLLEAKYGYLVFFYHETLEIKMFKVSANPERFEQICNAIDDFCINHLFTGKAPELDKEKDSYHPTDEEVEAHEKEVIELLDVMAELSELNKRVAAITEKRDGLLKRVMRIACDYRSMNLFGLKITVVKASPRFDYKAYVKDREKSINISENDKKKYSFLPKMSFRVSCDSSIKWTERKSALAQKRMEQVIAHINTQSVKNSHDDVEVMF